MLEYYERRNTMKKNLTLVVAVLFLAPAVFANNWGLGLKVGVGQNDPKDIKKFDSMLTAPKNSLDEEHFFSGLEAMYEIDLDNESNKIGIRLGYEGFGENKAEKSAKTISGSLITEEEVALEEETYAIPVTIYYKKDNGVNKLSYFAGIGATFVRSKLTYSEEEEVETIAGIDISETGYSESLSKGKIFPHIVLGAEYRFTELFALGLEAKYNIGAKVKKDGWVLSDRSGISGALTARFYF